MLKILEIENASLKKYNEYHQVVGEINHMSNLHVDSSFHKKSMNNLKLTVFISFKMTNIALGNQEFVNGLIGY